MAKILGGVALAVAFFFMGCQPEEPSTINLTAQDCARGGCYAK